MPVLTFTAQTRMCPHVQRLRALGGASTCGEEKKKNPVLEPEIGKAKGFVFHPQTSAMQQVELSQETPSKPTAHEAALSKQHLKGPSVPACPIPALEGRSDPVPGLQDGGPSAVP